MDIKKEPFLSKDQYECLEFLKTLGLNKVEFDENKQIIGITRQSHCDLSTREIELIMRAWQAKSQAVPEGFVLVEKKNLRDTYYLVDSEHVVDHPTEYELELECGEIATLEKWQRTKEVKVFCANIYSDEDNFEVVEFESIEDAEKAIAENKVMLEALEQSNG
ncbi:hypothetical protein [Acinetobacter tandoii]|uniref:Uncharacterized protein n=1 Tax=Acinetobacter tandoii DSM 14970 = CIP 107469 TaxID=1120927 RepID=R9AX66_9GAMM|nr:hypothetical protein [Acinetobacter tandoii]EOR06844.1 hypothetical protein I593_01711 [Acinetobacter tandoii DSM 14970 = CIP 107469]